MNSTKTVSSTKRRITGGSGSLSIYDFYPGYTQEFALDVLRDLGVGNDATVLDPWNGSGTTTWAATRLGSRAIGVDINPAMVVVAKARLADRTALKSLIELSKGISRTDLSKIRIEDGPDALEQWFSTETAQMLRGLQFRIGLPSRSPVVELVDYVDSLTTQETIAYLTLFELVRRLTCQFEGSNPTWIRVPKSPDEKIVCSCREIVETYVSILGEIDPSSLLGDSPDPSQFSILCMDTLNTHVRIRGRVQYILTSPPYCTRIDYAIATRRELAVLGLSGGEQFRQLRKFLIGTPLMTSISLKIDDAWGPTCTSFLKSVRSHDSKASATYYLKSHVQYFASIYSALRSNTQLLEDQGVCVIVAQGSYYKGIPNDLPQILIEMAESLSLTFRESLEFSAPSRYRHNPHARIRHSGSANTERVLYLQKERS